jgi:hypothetical protein
VYQEIADNILRIKSEVAVLSHGNTRILGAIKGVPKAVVDYVLDNNLLELVGENKAQEFRDKFEPRHSGKMHFIGRLQSNKVKYIAGTDAVIHSLDSLELTKEIEKRGGSKCLVQVNMGGEAAKGGISIDKVAEFTELVEKTCNKVNIAGLMGVFPILPQGELIKLYSQLAKVFEGYKAQFPAKSTLSAGMSDDYRIAIEYGGATIIRPGSVLFGRRNYI